MKRKRPLQRLLTWMHAASLLVETVLTKMALEKRRSKEKFELRYIFSKTTRLLHNSAHQAFGLSLALSVLIVYICRPC